MLNWNCFFGCCLRDQNGTLYQFYLRNPALRLSGAISIWNTPIPINQLTPLKDLAYPNAGKDKSIGMPPSVSIADD